MHLQLNEMSDDLTNAITERTWLNTSEAKVVLAVIADHLKTRYPIMNTIIDSVLEIESAKNEELLENHLN